MLKKIVQMGRADVVAELSDAEHGMREFISRDLNGFWITFGQALPAGA